MQHQRQMMRSRVAKKFARVPGQHGDAYIPMYYPIPVNPGVWGGPWAKAKDESLGWFMLFIVIPSFVYVYERHYHNYKTRICTLGKRAWHTQFWLKFNDQDDPDFELKWAALQGEYERGETVVQWGGTNMISSWLWEPGDPEPDKRRRAPPADAH